MSAITVSPLRDAARDLRTVASDLDHPECVTWHDGLLYCGTEHGALLAIDPDSGAAETVAETGGWLLGLTFGPDGMCYACDDGASRVVRIGLDGTIETVVEAVEGRRLTSPNYPAVDADGTLWVSESGSSWDSDDGYLFRVRRGGEAEIVDDACRRFPNGLAIAPDGDRLHVVESRWPGVSSYELRNGDLGPREESLPLPRTVPDGLAFDRRGRMYIGCWRPDRVYRWTPGGTLDVLLDDYTGEYLTTPTNLCFGGPDMETLYFASLSGFRITALDGEGAR